MFHALVIVLPLIFGVAAVLVPDRLAVRLIAVAVIALTFLVGLTGLVAPHRLAEEKLGARPSADWDRGARDTRDVVHASIPVVASCFGGLVLLALRPAGRIPKR